MEGVRVDREFEGIRRHREEMKAAFKLVEELCWLLCKVVGIVVFVILVSAGILNVVYIFCGESDAQTPEECDLTRPSDVLEHLMSINDQIITAYGIKNAVQLIKRGQGAYGDWEEEFGSLEMKLESVLDDLKLGETMLANYSGTPSGFNVSYLLEELDMVTGKVAVWEEKVDWLGVVETSEGPSFLQTFDFEDKEISSGIKCDGFLDKLETHFGIRFDRYDDSWESIQFYRGEIMLRDFNRIFKELHRLLLQREVVYDKFEEEFIENSPVEVDVEIEDEILKNVLFGDEEAIGFYHGNWSVVVELNEATESLMRRVEGFKGSFEMALVVQQSLIKEIELNRNETRVALQERRKAFREAVNKVDNVLIDLYIRTMRLSPVVDRVSEQLTNYYEPVESLETSDV